MYCIIGSSTETEEDLGRTIEFLKDMRDDIGFHQFVLNSGSDVRARSCAYEVGPERAVNQLTSEVDYRTTRGIQPSDVAVVFEQVKNRIGSLICTEVPVGPVPERSCINRQTSKATIGLPGFMRSAL